MEKQTDIEWWLKSLKGDADSDHIRIVIGEFRSILSELTTLRAERETLRDKFAMAVAPTLAASNMVPIATSAERSYEWADAMLAARKEAK